MFVCNHEIFRGFNPKILKFSVNFMRTNKQSRKSCDNERKKNYFQIYQELIPSTKLN